MTEHTNTKEDRDLVVLLHGILRHKVDMMPMGLYLEKRGFDTLNILYPSRKQSLEDLTAFVHKKITSDPRYESAPRIHFVTHSMGSLIARYLIALYRPDRLGNVVMLGPPNTGSEFADWLSDTKILAPLFEKIFGPAGAQLTTTHKHIDKEINYPVGVIAGCFSINPLAPWVLPGESDGIVPVDRTKIAGMTDHIVVPSTHTFMMFNGDVMKQVLNFLEHRHFVHDRSSD
ncbi:MAG: alpha/beta hydrolase [Alphaproteobacteria bacterium]|nr:alpha/beta hydrolase [Alphaproteobacteria bacterium]